MVASGSHLVLATELSLYFARKSCAVTAVSDILDDASDRKVRIIEAQESGVLQFWISPSKCSFALVR